MLVTLGAGLLLCFGEDMRHMEKNIAITILSGVLVLWNVALLGKFAWGVSEYNGSDSSLPGTLLLLLACYGVKKKNVLPVGAILALGLGVLYGILYLFALPNVELGALSPGKVRNTELLPYGFFPATLLCLYRGEKKKSRICWLAGALLLILLGGIITEGMAAKDFYTAAKSVNLLGTMERLEPFVAAAATAGIFCVMALLLKVNGKIIRERLRIKNSYVEEIEFILAAIICTAAQKVSPLLWGIGTTVCWGVIPILLQGIVGLKKVIKKSKKFEKSA